MIPASPRPTAAGVCTTLAALAAALLLHRSAAAHQPPPQPRSLGPAPAALPPLERARADTRLPAPLADLLPQSSAVVRGLVTRSEGFDEDRLQVHRVRVERVLRGRLDAVEPGVVDMHGHTEQPPLLSPGEPVILVLHPAPRFSYLANQLPADGTWLELVGERDGIVRLGSDREGDAIEQALAASAPDGDPETVRAARRARPFAWLRGPSPRLASDAVVELGRTSGLSPLSPAEIDAIRAALTDAALPPTTRAALAFVLADRGLREAAPALLDARIDGPIVLAAVFEARRTLGAPATRAEIDRWVDSDDPDIRAAAVEALATLPDADALAAVGGKAVHDPDAGVRAAAVDALGRSGRPEALPWVAETFDGTDRDLQQRSLRAMLAIGGTAGDETLARLALGATTPESRKYAALALAMTRGRDDPTVQRVLANSADADVRDVIEHGVHLGHHHGVDVEE